MPTHCNIRQKYCNKLGKIGEDNGKKAIIA